MDYSQVCQGWIYYIRNKVNGKMYIGKTNNFERRKSDHFSDREHSTILKRAYTKYGIENFEMIPILSFKAIDNIVLNKILNWLEVFYIAKYNTKESGYNATIGGDGLSGYAHREETKKKISEAHIGMIPSEESRIKMSKSNHSSLGENSKKPILLYRLDGSFFKEYNSTVEAVRELTGKRFSTTAETALRTPTSQAYGYLWRKKTGDNFPLYIDAYVNPRSRTVYHYSKEGQLLGTYICPKEASEKTGISLITIRCSTKKYRKYALTDYWSYEPPAA